MAVWVTIMNFQKKLHQSKRSIREWVRTNFSDQRLASVTAFNVDGRMSFRDPCGCLLGVTYSDPLHVDAEDCNQEHYWLARRQDSARSRRWAAPVSPSGMGKLEKAYLFLGFSPAFHTCLGDDEVRRRRLSALLRAEMRLRDRLRGPNLRNIVCDVAAPISLHMK